MKRASIVCKHGKPELERIVREVAVWLTSHQYSITVDAVAREF